MILFKGRKTQRSTRQSTCPLARFMLSKKLKPKLWKS